MGFMLWPAGIGWKEVSSTKDQGTFVCPNGRCKSNGPNATKTAEYRQRHARNWFAILYIPLIPLNHRGDYVECRSCKSVLPVSVLAVANPNEVEPRPSGVDSVIGDGMT